MDSIVLGGKESARVEKLTWVTNSNTYPDNPKLGDEMPLAFVQCLMALAALALAALSAKRKMGR